MKKTALQELINYMEVWLEKADKTNEIESAMTLRGSIKMAKALLPKEREDLEEAYNVGYRLDLPTGTYGKHYYEQTFEQ